MPYYLSQLVLTDRRLLPFGADSQANRNWILLDQDRALLWLENAVTEEARLRKFADDRIENLGGASRNLLSNFTGQSISSGTRCDNWLIDLLRNPPPSRWSPLNRPSKIRQQLELWFGPGGQGNNLFWSLPQVVGPNSKTFVDNFNRTAGNLSGSTSSDGLFTWTEVDGSDFATNGTQCDFSASEFNTAQAAADLDTDDHYSQAVVSGWTRSAGVLVAGVIVRFSGGVGYSFEIEDGAGGNDKRIIKRYDNDASVVEDTTLTNSGTIRLEVDGNSLTAKVNGITVLGPSTNTAFTGQLRCGIGAFSNDASNDFQFDDFQCGDLVAATKARPIHQRKRLFFTRSF